MLGARGFSTKRIRTFNRSLPVLSGLLKNDDLAVRTAAGEAIALLYELTDTSAATEEEVEDTDVDELPPVSNVSTLTQVLVGSLLHPFAEMD